MAYDLRLGGMVGTVAEIPDIDGSAVRVGFDYDAVTIDRSRFGPDALPALMEAIVLASHEAAKNMTEVSQ